MKILFIIVSLLLTTPSGFAENTLSAPVIKVSDGDTLTLLSASNKQIKIRLAGIDCPERGQPWGRNATEALRMFIGKEPVTVQALDTDRYGRIVGNVTANGVNINQRLVETGNCWVYPQYAQDKMLLIFMTALRQLKSDFGNCQRMRGFHLGSGDESSPMALASAHRGTVIIL